MTFFSRCSPEFFLKFVSEGWPPLYLDLSPCSRSFKPTFHYHMSPLTPSWFPFTPWSPIRGIWGDLHQLCFHCLSCSSYGCSQMWTKYFLSPHRSLGEDCLGQRCSSWLKNSLITCPPLTWVAGGKSCGSELIICGLLALHSTTHSYSMFQWKNPHLFSYISPGKMIRSAQKFQ